MSGNDYLKLGDWNALCSMCGRKRKAGEMVKNWQGMWRCPDHNEPRNAQDFVKNVVDIQTPPWVQPPPTDVFVEVCAPNDQTAYPERAIPDCVTPNFVSPFYDPTLAFPG